jgi:hypothetical protein
MRSVVWDRLVAGATNVEAARRILRRRSNIRLQIELNGSVSLDLSALDSKDYSKIDISQLTSEIQNELQYVTPVDGLEHSLNEFTDVDAIQTGKVSAALRRIRAPGRQEERLAILLDELLRDKHIGMSALLQYTDRARFANRAIQFVRQRIRHCDANNLSYEQMAAGMVYRLYTDTFPNARGLTLFFLAKHLSRYPAVRTEIRKKVQVSKSIYVRDMVDQIMKFVNAPTHG